jgi:hypothetical protein
LDRRRQQFFGEEMRRRERRSPDRTGIDDRASTSRLAAEVGALQCPNGANECGILHAYMERSPLPAESLGRHYPWCPTMHLRRDDVLYSSPNIEKVCQEFSKKAKSKNYSICKKCFSKEAKAKKKVLYL